jgi:hypothetical protein
MIESGAEDCTRAIVSGANTAKSAFTARTRWIPKHSLACKQRDILGFRAFNSE